MNETPRERRSIARNKRIGFAASPTCCHRWNLIPHRASRFWAEVSLNHGSPKQMQCLPSNVAIKRLGGIVPAEVTQPKKTAKRRDTKSIANGVRANNEDLRYNEIRRLLCAEEYKVNEKTSYLMLLQIGAWVICYPTLGNRICMG